MFGSCKHKTDFESLPEVSYVGNIAPIINSNCAFSGCHGDSMNASIKLIGYDHLMNGGINAGSPQNSKLYRLLKTLNDDIMPKKPYNELTEKQIQLIYVWIGQGAKNN
jgi:type 1 glutamine amidotransferase